MVLVTRFLANSWLSRWFRRLHYACTSFQGYMTELFEDEKHTSVKGKPSNRNRDLMTSLVRASQEEAKSKTSSETKPPSISVRLQLGRPRHKRRTPVNSSGKILLVPPTMMVVGRAEPGEH